jgi:hypothetical protein
LRTEIQPFLRTKTHKKRKQKERKRGSWRELSLLSFFSSFLHNTPTTMSGESEQGYPPPEESLEAGADNLYSELDETSKGQESPYDPDKDEDVREHHSFLLSFSFFPFFFLFLSCLKAISDAPAMQFFFFSLFAFQEEEDDDGVQFVLNEESVEKGIRGKGFRGQTVQRQGTYQIGKTAPLQQLQPQAQQKSVFDIDIESLEEKNWRKPGLLHNTHCSTDFFLFFLSIFDNQLQVSTLRITSTMDLLKKRGRPTAKNKFNCDWNSPCNRQSKYGKLNRKAWICHPN